MRGAKPHLRRPRAGGDPYAVSSVFWVVFSGLVEPFAAIVTTVIMGPRLRGDDKMKKSPARRGWPGRGCCRSVAIAPCLSAPSFGQLVEHLNDATGTRLDQHGLAVHHGVA